VIPGGTGAPAQWLRRGPPTVVYRGPPTAAEEVGGRWRPRSYEAAAGKGGGHAAAVDVLRAGDGVGGGAGRSAAAAEMRVGSDGRVSLCGGSQRIRFLIYYSLGWTVVN
jgi:hypothetical protein